jgi:hypothetical protein
MARDRAIDPIETPLDPDLTEVQPPLSGTVDDEDDVDDERSDENEAPTRELSDSTESREEFRLDEREEDDDGDLDAEDEDEDEESDESE